MAGLIPQPFIDELLARADIVDVVGSRLNLKKAGSNYQALCPFHTEKTPSFTVAPNKQFYHCFGCGAHGTALQFLMEYDRLEFPEAVEALAAMVGLEVPREVGRDRSGGNQRLLEVLAVAERHYRQWLRSHPERQRAVDYLRRRGLSGEVAARYGIGFAPTGWDNLLRQCSDRDQQALLVQTGMLIEKDGGRRYDRFRDRIMFPIRDRRGRVVAFGGRILDQGEPKYLNSPETPVFHKGRELYGLYECLQQERHPHEILVVEGYMDVVALAQHGFGNAVATLGTATSTQQVERLFQTTRNLVFCFDGDRAGRQAAWRALENTLPALRDERQARFLFLPDGEDPDSMVRKDRERFREQLTGAMPLTRFLFQELAADADLHSMDGRARLVERAVPLLGRVPPGVLRDLLLDELARIARVDRQHIDAALAGRPQQQLQQRRADGPGPTGGTTRRRQPQRRTTVRVAVALVLQRPSLAAHALPAELIRQLDLPGADVLAQLIEILSREPHLTTGALLERFRGSEQEPALWKLATWDHLVPDAGMENEFADAMRQLETLLARQRLQYLQQRLERNELTPEEHAEWLALLRAKSTQGG
ncbi:MAG: DNA primase [Ectothiorhodospiraceae bacterium]|nr:DNA primase [Ectothiorhodospiraceae bacterium]